MTNELRTGGADSEPAGLQPPTSVAIAASENLFTILGDQARSRSRAGLWTTVIGGAVNAGLVWWHYSHLSWLATGFVAAAAYGSWGLVDRAIIAKKVRPDAGVAEDSLPTMRDLIAVVGTGAAVWAVLGFMAAALGNWNH